MRAFARETPTLESVVQHHRRLVRRGRALERRLRDQDRQVAAREPLQHRPQAFRAFHRVESVRGLGEPRNAGFVQVGAERDHQIVPSERLHAGGDLPVRKIDPRNIGLQEPHAGVEQRRTRLRDLLERPLAEHDPGLAGADVKAVRPVHDDDAVLLRRQPPKRVRGGDPAEAAAEDDRLSADLASFRARAGGTPRVGPRLKHSAGARSATSDTSIPPAYRLTERRSSLGPVVNALRDWGQRHGGTGCRGLFRRAQR